VEWMSWAFFASESVEQEWEEEIETYIRATETLTSQSLGSGYDPQVKCMRPSLDPVLMLHRPLLWYFVGLDLVDRADSVLTYA
jgi:hypothetical protein